VVDDICNCADAISLEVFTPMFVEESNILNKSLFIPCLNIYKSLLPSVPKFHIVDNVPAFVNNIADVFDAAPLTSKYALDVDDVFTTLWKLL